VEKLHLPWRLVVMRRGGHVLAQLQALQPLLGAFDYASCGLYGRDEGMLVLRAAYRQAGQGAHSLQLPGRIGKRNKCRVGAIARPGDGAMPTQMWNRVRLMPT
jgi:hypothetical protein